MIQLTRINDSKIVINEAFIESIEETPDTVVILSNGRKLVVVENIETIMNMIIDFKNRTRQ